MVVVGGAGEVSEGGAAGPADRVSAAVAAEEYTMANTASAEKAARQSTKRYARNRWYRTRARTFVKRARTHIEHGQMVEAEAAIRVACEALDRAASKGVIHANNAARRKSRLMLAFNKARAAAAA